MSILDHPRFVLFTTLLLLIPLLSFFFLFPIHLDTDVRRGFAHRNGRSAAEFRKFAEHFHLSYTGLELWVVLVTSKEGVEKSMIINQNLLDEVHRLDTHLRNFSFVDSKGKVVSSSAAFGGEINHLFNWYHQIYSLAEFSDAINLTYPMARVYEHELFLGTHFFGVNENGTKEDAEIESAKTIGLWYLSDAPRREQKRILEEVEMDIFRLALNDSFSDIISFEMFGDQVANAEMFRGTVETRHLFIIGLVLMICFMALTFRHLTIKSMILNIIGAIASPALATAATFALLGWIGAPFNSIMCITPFLVLAIGVDDGFLLLHAWRRHSNEKRRSVSRDEEGTKEKSRAEITRAVLIDVAPSMAITSATNTMAFGVGVFSPTEQMSAFCLCTALAILMDFLFEFLLYMPILSLTYESRRGDQAEKIEKKYTRVLLSNAGKGFVLTLLLTLYASSFIGLMSLESTFDPSKAFPSDSRLTKSLHSFEELQTEYNPLSVITRRVPRIDNYTEIESYKEMNAALGARPGCRPELTQNTLIDFIEWRQALYGDERPSYRRLPQYLKAKMMSELRIVDYSGKDENITVHGVNFLLVCKGVSSWAGRAHYLEETRQLLDTYPLFETTIFDYDSTIYDIVVSCKEEVIKAVSITFVCMAVACVIFIPSVIGASVAVFSMLSITYTMLGMFSHWGAALDPVTMINILIAIGFSVDFSAHICFHFCKHRNTPMKSKEDRMATVLKAVGKPIFEASMSTFICVVPLFSLKIYIFNCFAKTVCLVAVFGLFHGLVIIPIILSFFLPEHSPMLEESEGRRECEKSGRPLLSRE